MGYSIEHLPVSIGIGRETEAGVTEVRIDCTAWLDRWPGMAVTLIHCPYNGTPYMPVTRMDGPVLVWPVTDADTAAPGMGRAEVDGRLDGVHVVSAMVQVMVRSRMPGTAGDPPEPAKPWVDEVTGAAARAEGSAQAAQTSAANAQSFAQAAQEAAEGVVTAESERDQAEQARVQAEQARQEAEKAREEVLPSKLTEPATGLEVGKYFRVAAIDEHGHAVLEAVDLPSAPVQDVKINGTSIAADGVANVKLYTKSFGMNAEGLYLKNANHGQITERSSNVAVTPQAIDYAVKAAMCDGNGAAWTSDEQAAARERMGIPGDYELIEEITLEEAVNAVERSTEPDGTLYNFCNMFVKTYAPGVTYAATMNVRYYYGEKASIIAYISGAVNTDNRYGISKAEEKFGYLEAYGSAAGSTTYSVILSLTGTTYSEYMTRSGTIKRLSIMLQGAKLLPVGSKIQIYGVRA